ncbi:hypothetical protein AAFF_G00064030 [Aldrovandia affinis]|uniref:Uncharacterized protein n=1 Tax=Aldrovandia affinis TaxID=143900 RepID=A0AAD7WYM4_9TELE|nr:hypothetical protein AAFF_G00064030 [Aldrovandia affinis]
MVGFCCEKYIQKRGLQSSQRLSKHGLGLTLRALPKRRCPRQAPGVYGQMLQHVQFPYCVPRSVIQTCDGSENLNFSKN